MKVKLINAALKRVEVPDLSPTNREAFTAGVRALAYELEKDVTPDYEDTLLDAISKEVGVDVSGKNCTPEYAEHLRKMFRHVAAAGCGAEQMAEGLKACANMMKQQPGRVESVPVTLTDQLSALTSKVYDNKAAFLEHFDLLGKVDSVEEFYMAGDRCVVMYEDWQNPQPQDISTTIKTADFLAWAEGLDNG